MKCDAARDACAKMSPVAALDEALAQEQRGEAKPQPKCAWLEVAMKGLSGVAGQKTLDAIAIPAGNHIHLQNELDSVGGIMVL